MDRTLNNLGEMEQARAIADRVLAAAQRKGLPFFVGQAHYIIGLVEVNTGHYVPAANSFSTAFEIFKRLGSLPEEAWCAYNIAYCASYTGKNGEPYVEFDTPAYALKVAVAGNTAYVADQDAGLRILDLSDPANPVEAGFYDTPGAGLGVAVSGKYAYVADGEEGLQAIDVSEPADLRELASFDTFDGALASAVMGDYAYVADAFGGLVILRMVEVPDKTYLPLVLKRPGG